MMALRPPTTVLLVLGPLAWLVGLALQLQQAGLWPVGHYQGLLVASLAALLLWAATRLVALDPAERWPAGLRGLQHGLLPLALAGLAFASTGWRAEDRLAERLAAALEGADLVVTGVVDDLPQRAASGTRFVFKVEQASTLRGQAVTVPPLLALGWYAGFDDTAWMDAPAADLRAGQRWRLPLRLKQPHGLMNPHGFDSELWWFSQGVGAQGHVRVVRGGAAAQRLDDAPGYPVARWREHLREAIWRQVPDARVAGVLAALVVGDQAAISRDDWELFRQTGIAHLVSISGVHVTMFAWLAAAVVGWAWRRWPRAMLACPAPLAARLGGLALATGYALLAGWGVPAQRTVLMLAAATLMRSAVLDWPWPLVLLLAACAVTVLEPWALLQAGFWLSFAAVGLLMASEPVRGAAPVPGWRGWLGVQFKGQAVATLGLAPLGMVFFQQISVVGALANLVAIPLVTLLITPLALLGALLPPLWWLAGALVQAMVAGLAWLATWPLAVWQAAAAPPWAMACGLAAALLGVLPIPWRLRALALPLALPLLAPPPHWPAPGQFELVAVDIGQGTAVLVRTQTHLLVYDSGPTYGPDNDAGQRVLLPLLRARGEPRIDTLLLSHRDTDHVGGAAALMAGLPVGLLLSGLEPGHRLHGLGVPVTACAAGQRWSWDGVAFEVLHPTEPERAVATKSNAVSCVLRVQDAQGRSALLTGDIEAAQEAALVQRLGSGLASTLLLVPHHGSRTSSTTAFLQAVRPQVAVVQAAYRSRFGHPAQEVLARYQAQGIAVVRNDHCGAWLWHDGAQACTRQVRRRHWHWTAPAGGAIVATPEGSGALTR